MDPRSLDRRLPLSPKERQLWNWGRAPVRLLPELLSTIFEMACLYPETSEKFVFETAMDRLRDVRLAITMVCGRWRAVALDTASLWSRIAWQHGPSRMGLHPGLRGLLIHDAPPYDGVEHELEHSKNSLLALRLETIGGYDTHPTLSLLVTQLYRCRSLFLNVNGPRPRAPPLVGPLGQAIPLPHLRTASVWLYRFETRDVEDALDFRGAPMLKHLSINALSLSVHLPPHCLISNLHVYDMDPNVLLGVLAACPVLEVLLLVRHSASFSSSTIFHLPRLRVLSLSRRSHDVISHFDSPNLEILVLGGIHPDIPLPFPHLRSLNLSGVYFDVFEAPGAIDQIFSLHALEEFGLVDFALSDLLEVRMGSVECWECWPKLRVLHFDVPAGGYSVSILRTRVLSILDNRRASRPAHAEAASSLRVRVSGRDIWNAMEKLGRHAQITPEEEWTPDAEALGYTGMALNYWWE